MRRDPTEFRKRVALYKLGKSPYKDGRPVKLDDGTEPISKFLYGIPYSGDKDPRGFSRYMYPDRMEGETHGDFETLLSDYVYSGIIPNHAIHSYFKNGIPVVYSGWKGEFFIDDLPYRDLITPIKGVEEVVDSAASYNKQRRKNRELYYNTESENVHYNKGKTPLHIPKFNTGTEPEINPETKKPLIEKSDATRVAPTYSVYVGDDENVQQAANDATKAEWNMLYGAARFIPYVKYVTDALDLAGASPDQNGEKDFSDSAVLGKIIFNKLINLQIENNKQYSKFAKTGSFVIKPGKILHSDSQFIKDGMSRNYLNNVLKLRTIKKLNPLGMINGAGDAKQAIIDFNNLLQAWEREKSTLKFATLKKMKNDVRFKVKTK